MKKSYKFLVFASVLLLAVIGIVLIQKWRDDDGFVPSRKFMRELFVRNFIRKQDDNVDNPKIKSHKAEFDSVYKYLYSVKGDIEWVMKHVSYTDKFEITLSIYYLQYGLQKHRQHYSKIIVRDVDNKISVETTDSVKWPLLGFAGICDDQYYYLSPFDGFSVGNYSIAFLGRYVSNPSREKIMYFSVIIDSFGRNLKDVRTDCIGNEIGDYLKIITQETK
jgi:hypothetical protein